MIISIDSVEGDISVMTDAHLSGAVAIVPHSHGEYTAIIRLPAGVTAAAFRERCLSLIVSDCTATPAAAYKFYNRVVASFGASFPASERTMAEAIRDQLNDITESSSIKSAVGAALKVSLKDGQEYVIAIAKTK